MKKILLLTSLILSFATVGAFAAVITDPVPTPIAPTQNTSPKSGKHKHKKHVKHHNKKTEEKKAETK